MSGKRLLVPPRGPSGFLRSLPALEALATGTIAVIFAEPDVAGLVPLLRAPALSLDRRRAWTADVDALRAAGAEEVVVLDDEVRAARVARAAGIPDRWGYRQGFLRGAFLNRPVPDPPDDGRPAAEDPRELLAAMDVEPPASWEPRLALGDDARARGEERLARAGLRSLPDEPRIGVYPGTAGGASRPWPRSRWEDLLRRLRRDVPARRLVLLATDAELWSGVRLHEETGKVHPLVGPDLDLAGMAGLLASLDLVVAAESWILLLAAAMGTPTVGLFARPPSRWAPPGEAHRAVGSGSSSLATVEVEDVVATIDDLG